MKSPSNGVITAVLPARCLSYGMARIDALIKLIVPFLPAFDKVRNQYAYVRFLFSHAR